ncbi:MAG: PQQ-binding-like beta-propeller repeat protein [Gemmataceae bacterium]
MRPHYALLPMVLLILDGRTAQADSDTAPTRSCLKTQPSPAQQPAQQRVRAVAAVRLGSSNWRFSHNVAGLAYSADGKKLIVAEGQLIRVLDAQTGKEHSRFNPNGYFINSCSVAGDKIAIVGGNLALYVWDWRKRKKLVTFKSHRNGAQNIRISPNGRYVAATGDDVVRKESILVRTDYSVRVWDTHTGKQLLPFKKGLRTGFCGVFSPDNRLFAWSGHTGVQILKLQDGTVLVPSKLDSASDLAFSPNARLLACSKGKEIRIVEVATSQIRSRFIRKGPIPLGGTNNRVVFSPDSRLLAAASTDGSTDLWDVVTGEHLGRMVSQYKRKECWVEALAFSPDGKTLAVAPHDQTIRLWDVATKKQRNGLEDRRPIRSVLMLPDGKTIITSHKGGLLSWWDRATGKKLHLTPRTTGGSLLALSKDGEKLYSIEGKNLVCWDVKNRKLVKSPLPPMSEAPTSLKLSSNDRTLAVGFASGLIQLWDLQTQKCFHLQGHKGQISSLVFTPDGKQLVSGSGSWWEKKPYRYENYEHTIKLWDVAKAKEIRQVGKAPKAPECLSISPDGKLLVSNATASDSTGIPIWNLAKGEEVHRVGPYDSSLSCVAFSPDGKLLVVARWQVVPNTTGRVELLDTRTWKRVAVLDGQHKQQITSMTFSSNSEWLVTGSEDSSGVVWKLTR